MIRIQNTTSQWQFSKKFWTQRFIDSWIVYVCEKIYFVRLNLYPNIKISRDPIYFYYGTDISIRMSYKKHNKMFFFQLRYYYFIFIERTRFYFQLENYLLWCSASLIYIIYLNEHSNINIIWTFWNSIPFGRNDKLAKVK